MINHRVSCEFLISEPASRERRDDFRTARRIHRNIAISMQYSFLDWIEEIMDRVGINECV